MNTILVLLPASARLYKGLLLGIRRRIGSHYRLQVIDYVINDNSLRKIIGLWNPIGCVVAAAEGLTITHAAFGKTPVVYLDRTPTFDGDPLGTYLDVAQDYAENGRLAANELFQPDIENYAFVGYRTPTHWSRVRGEAFANAVRILKKKCAMFPSQPAHCTRAYPYTPPGERLKLLEEWLIHLPKPVGIFTANDLTAYDVHTICSHNNLRIPAEVSLLGIDNIVEICEEASPKISSILSDFEQGGWLCADLLLERLRSSKLRKAIRLYPTLGIIRRGSTRFRGYGRNSCVDTAIKTIQTRAFEGLSVDDIASEMNCSRRIAEIKFRNATGKTIKDIITQVRLERAQVLIRDLSLSIGEIASACGYNTENAFRMAFSKRFLKTPNAYRDSRP